MSKETEKKDKLKFVNEYLNEKPKPNTGFWGKLLGFLALGAKAYLRYEELNK